MHELRLQLASARATLRAAKDDHELARAQAEQRAIDAGCNGKNADERARNLTLALAEDDLYQRALARLRAAEAEVERLDALLESTRDARRAEEWHIRARLADGLFRAGVQSDSADAAGESAFDDTLDHVTGERLELPRCRWVQGQTAEEDLPW